MRLNRRQKITAAAAASALGALSVLGGTYAAFTATDSTPAQTIQSGTVVIAFQGGTFGAPIDNTSPGDITTRNIDLANIGSIAFDHVTMSQASLPAAAGKPDLSDKYSVKILRVNAPGPDLAYGTADDVMDTVTPVLAVQTLAAYAAQDLPLVLTDAEKAAGAVTHLQAVYTFDSTADDTFQGLTDTVKFTVNAQQRNAGVFVETSPKGTVTGR